MRDSQSPRNPVGEDHVSSWHLSIRADEVFGMYVDWREEAALVAEAFYQWSVAPAPDTALRFAAYTAALDQEESAAAAYAQAMRQLDQWVRDSRSGEDL